MAAAPRKWHQCLALRGLSSNTAKARPTSWLAESR
jgi:hypothetical protein